MMPEKIEYPKGMENERFKIIDVFPIEGIHNTDTEWWTSVDVLIMDKNTNKYYIHSDSRQGDEYGAAYTKGGVEEFVATDSQTPMETWNKRNYGIMANTHDAVFIPESRRFSTVILSNFENELIKYIKEHELSHTDKYLNTTVSLKFSPEDAKSKRADRSFNHNYNTVAEHKNMFYVNKEPTKTHKRNKEENTHGTIGE